MTTQTSRLVEATQFTIQDYEVFKTGTAFDNKFRQAAMEKMALDEKDPQSELNKLGLKEVRRIRVLRDPSDTEGKNLTIVYETKTDKRKLEMEAYKKDQQKAIDMRYTFPVWIADTKDYLKRLFTELVEWVDAHPSVPKEVASTLEAELKKVVESKLDNTTLTEVRVVVYKLLHSFTTKEMTSEGWEAAKLAEVKAENELKSELFNRLDFLAAALNFLPKVLFDKSSFLAYATSLRPPRQVPNGNAGRPPRENRGNDKPQQNRQHRSPKQAGKSHPQA